MIKEVKQSIRLINIFTIFHVLIVYFSERFGISDEWLLSFFTVTMVVILGFSFEVSFDVIMTLTILTVIAGFLFGTLGSKIIELSQIKWMCRFSNEIVTLFITQFIGWISIFISIRKSKLYTNHELDE